MTDYKATDIRNIALVAHGGTGKTSLVEAMSFDAGLVNRLGRVDDGSTVSDFDPDEIKRKISVNLSLVPLEWNGTKINVIDTPGYADFVGEEKSGLRAADGALLLVDAAAGIQVGTENAWRFAHERSLPVVIVVNQNGSRERGFRSGGRRTRGAVRPPVHPAAGSDRIAGSVLGDRRPDQHEGTRRRQRRSKSRYPPTSSNRHSRIASGWIEARLRRATIICSTSSSKGKSLGSPNCGGLCAALSYPARLSPCWPVAQPTIWAWTRSWMPSWIACHHQPTPPRRSGQTSSGADDALTPDPAASLAAFVFKTTADPFTSWRLSFVRIYRGTLKSDSQLWNTNKAQSERVGPWVFFISAGRTRSLWRSSSPVTSA